MNKVVGGELMLYSHVEVVMAWIICMQDEFLSAVGSRIKQYVLEIKKHL